MPDGIREQKSKKKKRKRKVKVEPEPESLIAKYNIYQTQHKFRENSGKIAMERGGNSRRKSQSIIMN